MHKRLTYIASYLKMHELWEHFESYLWYIYDYMSNFVYYVIMMRSLEWHIQMDENNSKFRIHIC